MIDGFFRSGSPRILASVSLPTLSPLSREVEFVVDTGSSVTVLQMPVLVELGADPEVLRSLPLESNIGAGGLVAHALQAGEIELASDDGGRESRTIVFRLALLPPNGAEVPSVLGMDLLSAYRVIVSVQEGRVALEDPLSSPPA